VQSGLAVTPREHVRSVERLATKHVPNSGVDWYGLSKLNQPDFQREGPNGVGAGFSPDILGIDAGPEWGRFVPSRVASTASTL